MPDTTDHSTLSPAALAQNLRDIRERAQAQWLTYLSELQVYGRDIKAQLQDLFVQEGGAMVVQAGSEAAARELMRQGEVCHQTFRYAAVKGAITTGRILDEDEDEAMARCADDAGLFAFLDDMSKVPLGFVDTYVPPARAN
ncbi:hypothetical protein AWN54_06330 [Enterococcus faecium]|uniref:hypothetical protein n=1 Tax=Enterococcus faecium TaxID=1352 RepID=UPI0007635B86|nr:hypothetical protein [Enterococcus faecium]KWW76007.1 hypothetical protein AWN54_06330 [Enterococcus faecium]